MRARVRFLVEKSSPKKALLVSYAYQRVRRGVNFVDSCCFYFFNYLFGAACRKTLPCPLLQNLPRQIRRDNLNMHKIKKFSNNISWLGCVYKIGFLRNMFKEIFCSKIYAIQN